MTIEESHKSWVPAVGCFFLAENLLTITDDAWECDDQNFNLLVSVTVPHSVQ
jgi:hypothetical protein